MSVFKFTEQVNARSEDAPSQDSMFSAMLVTAGRCAICREHVEDGQRLMVWRVWQGGDDLVFHADCVKPIARGLIKDIAECLR